MFCAIAVAPYETHGETKGISWRYFDQLMRKFDVKRYIIAVETGHGGYKHWQTRF